MSDLGGLGGALLLSNQISTNRLLDSMQRNREVSALNASEHGWRSQYNELVDRYNALLADSDRLCQKHDEHVALLSSTIDDHKATAKEAEAEQARLRANLEGAAGNYRLLMAVIKDNAPELYDKLNY